MITKSLDQYKFIECDKYVPIDTKVPKLKGKTKKNNINIEIDCNSPSAYKLRKIQQKMKKRKLSKIEFEIDEKLIAKREMNIKFTTLLKVINKYLSSPSISLYNYASNKLIFREMEREGIIKVSVMRYYK